MPIIPEHFYSSAFYISITLFTILGILPLFKYTRIADFPEINKLFGIIFLLLIIILFIGFRNPYANWRYFGDTYNYTRKLEAILHNVDSKPEADIGFYYYMKFVLFFGDVVFFYIVSGALYVVPIYLGLKKWLGYDSYFALLVCVASMSFWSFGVNVLRNGLATSFFFYALSFFDRKWIMGMIILVAVSFHKSILLPAVALIIVHFYNNPKVLLKIWMSAIPISFLFGRKIQALLNVLYIVGLLCILDFILFIN